MLCRLAIVMLTTAGLSSPLLAVDPGKAEGALIVDGVRTDLTCAYAVNHQANELTRRKDDTRIVLTNKPLADGIKLDAIDDSFPVGTLGIVVCVTPEGKVSHVVVEHARGMYDAGYFERDGAYVYKPVEGDRGTIGGNVSARRVQTNTMTFSFDVDFNAVVK